MFRNQSNMPATRFHRSRLHACFLFGLLLAAVAQTSADDLDTVGVTQLRQASPTLIGTGVSVAQPEGIFGPGNGWEVKPQSVGQPVSLFTYTSSNGTDSIFPNSVGAESGHANVVGLLFYAAYLEAGQQRGVAPGVSHVDNYDADYFYENIIRLQTAINAKVVNQSFIFFSTPNVPEQQMVDSAYDNYAARYNVLFLSGAGNGGTVSPAATAYNGMGVGVIEGNPGTSSIGPTPDNGRSKPDITAPQAYTSFSTPLVAGAAALLVQAGNRGDGGAGTGNASTDIRMLKALLLNGAVKPADWSHSTSTPLDTRYGAGVLQVYNSYRQLVGGQHAFIDLSSNLAGNPHPPTSATGNVSALTGWDFGIIDNNAAHDTVNHYYFQLNGNSESAFIATLTLAWNRQLDQTDINNLDLFLYDTKNNSLVASSQSGVDNVEHIFISGLKPGRYDLQVLKNGGTANRVSNDETYALAFDFAPLTLGYARSGNSIVLSWAGSATQFGLQSSTNLALANGWTAVTNQVIPASGQNTVTVAASGDNQVFRLVKR